jgi:hypothetical protein
MLSEIEVFANTVKRTQGDGFLQVSLEREVNT